MTEQPKLFCGSQLMRMLAKTAGRAVTGPLRTSTKDISEFIRLAKMSAQSSIRLPSWQLQLREIPDVTIVESLVTCARTVWPPQKGEKVKTSFSLGIVHAVAKADIGQGNAALNLTKVANPFRETCKGRPLQRPQPQLELSEQQSITGNSRKCTISNLGAATCGSAGLDLVTTGQLILKEQAQVIVAPTGVWGPLPSGTVGLILGRSSITTKGIFVQPGVTDPRLSRGN